MGYTLQAWKSHASEWHFLTDMGNYVMVGVLCIFLYLAIKKDYERPSGSDCFW